MCRAYVPPGHVGLVEAAKIIARERYPQRWRPEAMAPGEQELWNSLDQLGGLRPELFAQHINVRISPEMREEYGSIERCCDFAEAQQDLWKGIGQGLLEVRYTEDDGSFRPISAQIWRTPAGLEAIQAGRVTMDLSSEYLTTYPWVSKAGLSQIISRSAEHMPENAAEDVPPWVSDANQSEFPAIARRESGLPGRPSSKQLYRREAERRIAEGEYPESIAAFSRELAQWLKNTHPDQPASGAKAIENAVRDLWNASPAKSPRNTP